MGAAVAAAGVAGAGGLFSAYEAGQAGKAQAGYYSYLANTSKINAGLALATGEERTKEIGAQEFQQVQGLQRKISQTIGAEKAAVVTGAGAGSRTAQDIVNDTMEKGNLDEMAVRYNAAIATKDVQIGARSQAMNYNLQAGGYNIAGGNAAAASRLNQVSSLLGGASSVSNIWERNPSMFTQ